MPRSPLSVLERLSIIYAPSEELVALGKKLIEQYAALKAYAHNQCAKADEALQGKCSFETIQLLDLTKIKNLQQLLAYRNFMSKISDYQPQQRNYVWLEMPITENQKPLTENEIKELLPPNTSLEGIIILQNPPVSMLELCALLGFGYGKPNIEQLVTLIREEMQKNPEEAKRILKEAIAENPSNPHYDEFLLTNYKNFISE